MRTTTKVIITAGVIAVVVGAIAVRYWEYLFNPWTRNGQVMAQVVQVTPRVTGTIVELPIVDNQFVKKGDLLFRIDPRTYESTLSGMRGLLAETIDEIEALGAQVDASEAVVEQYEAQIKRTVQQVKAKEAQLADYQAQFKRYSELVKTGASSRERVDQATADVISAEARVEAALQDLLRVQSRKIQAEADLAKDIANRGALGDANARLRTAKARVHSAELALEFTEVRAEVNGYITNMNLRVGDHATANKAALALVDTDSYWIYGFFKESLLEDINPGDRAIVTLMTYPDKPIEGHVDSKAWGVWQKDGSTAQELLPFVAPTFEWIRLAQRVPVRIEIDEVPEGVELVVGTTGSVLVLKDTAGTETMASVPPVPSMMQ